MSSRNITLADAVTAALNAATLSKEFESERVLLPQKELEEYKELTVLVCPVADRHASGTRVRRRHDMSVHIAIAKHLEPTTNPADPNKCEEVDALIQFGEEVADLFVSDTKLGGLCLFEVDHDPIYDPMALKDKRSFFSLITLTFRTFA